MSQVSYGTITITDTTDLTTYIRYAKKSPLTTASDFQETPTTDTHFIAVLSIPSSNTIPAWNSTDWKWSEFIGTDGLSVKSTRILYYLKTNSTNVPQVDKNTSIVSTDTQNAWTSKNPTYVANGTYWTCLEVTLSDNTTKSWSAPAEDLGLTQAAKDAAETKSIAQHSNENAQGALGIARAMQQNFWWWGEDHTVDSSFTLPAGAYTSDIKVDAFKANPTGGYLVTRSDGVYLNNGRYVLMGLTGTSLKFYRPGTTQLLSGTETVDAELTSNGLKINNGSIVLGSTTGTAAGNITLSNQNFNRSIDNISRIGLRFAIGSNFGVKDDGTLYASNAVISGSIESGRVGTSNYIYISTKTYGTDNHNPTSTTVAGVSSSGWKMIVGDKFGVDLNGRLCAAYGQIGAYILNNGELVCYGNDRGQATETTGIYRAVMGAPQSSSSNSSGLSTAFGVYSKTSQGTWLSRSQIRYDGSIIAYNFQAIDENGLVRAVVDTDGLKIYDNSSGLLSERKVAQFGSSIQVGKSGSSHISIGNTTLTFNDGTDDFATFGESIQLGKDSSTHMLINSGHVYYYGEGGNFGGDLAFGVNDAGDNYLNLASMAETTDIASIECRANASDRASMIVITARNESENSTYQGMYDDGSINLSKDLFVVGLSEHDSLVAQMFINDTNFVINDGYRNALSLGVTDGSLTLRGEIYGKNHNSAIGTTNSHSDSKSVSSAASPYTPSALSGAVTITSGTWILVGTASFQANTSGVRYLDWHRGSTTLSNTAITQQAVSTSGVTTKLQTTAIVNVPEDSSYDMYLYCYQTSGSQLTVNYYWQIVRII